MATERRQLLALLAAALLTAAPISDAAALTLRRSVFAGAGHAADRTVSAFTVAGEAITGRSQAGSLVLWHGFPAPQTGAASSVAVSPRGALLLAAPAPNPCSTRVALRVGGVGAESARLAVYDVRGRLVRRLPMAPAGAGAEAAWDLVDGDGRRVAAGLYIVRAGEHAASTSRAVMVLP